MTRTRKLLVAFVGILVICLGTLLWMDEISYRGKRSTHFNEVKTELEHRVGTKLDVTHDSVPRLLAEVIQPGMARDRVHELVFAFHSTKSGPLFEGGFFDEYLYRNDLDVFLYVTYNQHEEVTHVQVQ